MNTGVNYAGKRVIVGLTGRVGSAVAAFLLKKQGMDVIGVSIVTNISESFEDSSLYPRCHIEDLAQVQAFCEDLKIPFYATDGKSQFENDVLDPLLATKLSCGSNQSCFNCTNFRLDVLYEKMVKLRADFIATGHFCKVQKNFTANEYFVHSNGDKDSDQSFLLSGVNAKYLKHLLLPLGELRAVEVEKIARNFDLKVTPSKANSNFCFKEEKSFSFYSDKKIPKSLLYEGQVINVDTENFHGDHDGVTHHFITEKDLTFKAINQGDKDLEVVGYDFDNHLLKIGSRDNLTFTSCQLIELKLSKGFDRTKSFQSFIKTKYTNDFVKCTVYFKNNSTALLEFEQEIYPVITGETLVLFDKNTRNSKVIGQGKVGEGREFELIDRAREFRSIDPDAEVAEVFTQVFKF
jgi:tRNA-specific 2-thiouridylase